MVASACSTSTPQYALLKQDQRFDGRVEAVVAPPTGWTAAEAGHGEITHLVWESPTKSSAYGVMYFTMPLPVAANYVLPEFIRRMKAETGQANLIDKQWDDERQGMRFIVENDKFRMRVLLVTRWFKGWAIYAGTRVNEPVAESELRAAEAAREATTIE